MLTENEKLLLDYYKKTGKPIKLNIGCRNKIFPNFINLDINPENKLADIIDNGFTLEKFEDNSISLIYSSHVFEHLDYKEGEQALKVWYNKLKPGGIVRVSVPCAIKAAALMILTGDRVHKALFMGRQREGDQWDYHRNIFTKEWLTTDLENAGFVDVKEWNPHEEWPHYFVDDFSRATYPTFSGKIRRDDGKIVDLGGVNVSLNLQAFKPLNKNVW